VRKLQADIGRAPTAGEVMAELKISSEEYEALLKDVARLGSTRSARPTIRRRHELRRAFRVRSSTAAIPTRILELQKQEATGVVLGELIDKEREVLELYYFEGLTMKEIAKLLRLLREPRLPDPRQALTRLRGELVGRAEDLGTS